MVLEALQHNSTLTDLSLNGDVMRDRYCSYCGYVTVLCDACVLQRL